MIFSAHVAEIPENTKTLVTVVTVVEDLAVAVVVGVIVSALVFAWNSASRIHAVGRDSKTEKGAKVYEIDGPLFFGFKADEGESNKNY